MKKNNKKIYIPIYAAIALTPIIIIYIFLSGYYEIFSTDPIMVYLGILSFLLAFICILIPILTKDSKKSSHLTKYSYYLYGPAYFFIISGLLGISSLWSWADSVLPLIFPILLIIGFIFTYKLAKRIDQKRRAEGEIK